MSELTFRLKPVPPFRLDLTVWVLRRRPHNLMDRWENETYRRVLLVGEQPLAVTLSQSGPPEAPELRVEACCVEPEMEVESEIGYILAALLTRMLGLDIDLQEFYRFATHDPRVQTLVRRFLGVKPPRYPTVFEALVNAIACQQISLTVGIHVLNRLTQAFGTPLKDEAGAACAFPQPRELAGLEPQALRDLGFSYNKARTIIELSQKLVAGEVNLENLDSLDDDAAVKALSRLRGIGRWTAEYALLRGLGRTYLFPADDLGARKRLQTCLNLSGDLDYQGVQQALAGFQPFGGLLYFHFLLSHLAEEGHLDSQDSYDP